MADDRPIAELRNIGPVSGRRLQVVGISTAGDLEAYGAAAAFVRIKDAGFRPSLNLLWALQGALLDLDWSALPKELKAKLRRQVEVLSQED